MVVKTQIQCDRKKVPTKHIDGYGLFKEGLMDP